METALRQFVIERARHRCEYCRIPQDGDPFFTFPVDHIIAQQHGGMTSEENLALSCIRCNSHKGPNIASLDPVTGQLIALFHPRRDIWADHFEWNGGVLDGRSPVGRATVTLLAINHPDSVQLREQLIDEGMLLTD